MPESILNGALVNGLVSKYLPSIIQAKLGFVGTKAEGFSYKELSWLSPSNEPLDTKVMLLACRYLSIHEIGQSMTSASSIALRTDF